MKILNESIQDIEKFLKYDIVNELVDVYGEKLSDFGKDIPEFVVDRVTEQFGDSANNIKVSQVVICKVIGNEVDLIEQSHPVVEYNGHYYDYTAQEFNELFSDLIGITNLPVVQKIIRSDNQISERLSTIKSYVMLGY